MLSIRFTWDEAKNLSNQKKHDGIGFEVAAHVFNDPLRLMVQDRTEDGEERWQTLGVVHGVTVLLVACSITGETEGRDPVEIIRIISARRATRKERKRYEQENS